MSEMSLINLPYPAILSLDQQRTLSQEACRLYAFIYDRARRKDAIEVSTTNIEAISRSRCRPENLQTVQAELHRSGLLQIEEAFNPRHEPHQIRTKYTLTDQQNG